MKYIEIGIVLNDELGVKSAIIHQNDTELPSNSELIKKVCITLLKSLSLNKQDLELQDMLIELNINQ